MDGDRRLVTSALGILVVAGASVAASRGPGERLATIAGTVTYSGPAAPGSPIDMGNDPYCVEANRGRDRTLSRIVMGAGGGLAHVVVHVREGAPEGASAPRSAAEPPVLDQRDCEYVPHLLTVAAGAEFIIRNSDETLHNVHARPERNRSFNIGQPLPGIEARRMFAIPEIVPVSCDIHGWMHSVIAVFDHPFFAVTGEDGAFELPDLPPGSYVIEAWHEALGTRTRSVTVGTDARVSVSFDFGG